MEKTIKLTEKELKLLVMILEECEESRSDMCCNDPYENEEELFTEDERREIGATLRDPEDQEDLDDFLYNCDYVEYIKNVIKKQIE